MEQSDWLIFVIGTLAIYQYVMYQKNYCGISLPQIGYQPQVECLLARKHSTGQRSTGLQPFGAQFDFKDTALTFHFQTSSQTLQVLF